MVLMRRLELQHYLTGTSCFHLGKSYLEPGDRTILHTHDFAEVFWVGEGSGRHSINGRDQILGTGSIVFVRPNDMHELRGCGDSGVNVRNVAFRSDVVEQFLSPPFENLFFNWHSGQFPRSTRLSSFILYRLDEVFHDSLRSHQSEIDLRFLLTAILRESNRSISPAFEGESAPFWLVNAMNAFSHSASLLREGRSALVRLCAKSREHVAREVRRHNGITLSQFVNRARVVYASGALRDSQNTILAVAAEVGFEDLSHFYRNFKAVIGVTPGEYQKRSQGILGHTRE